MVELRLREIGNDLGWRLRRYRAERARARSKATFIGITGSSGKSTATSLLGHILASHGTVYTQVLANTLKALVRTLYKRMKRAGKVDYVVFEAGAFEPGSIRSMAEMLKPDVAVVTMVRLEHVTQFRTLDAVAQEKRALVEALSPGGLAILNADDPHVLDMASGARCRVATFGQSEAADYRVTNIHAAYPDLLRFSLRWRGGDIDMQTRFPGEHFWLPAAAAAVTALELGVPPEKIAARTASFEPLANRCAVLVTDRGPQFIVDAAKAPWHSLNIAFEMMAKAKAVRKRIVVGQISDYTGSSRKYGAAYGIARDVADEVIYTGDNAHRSRASQADRDSGRFIELRTPKEVSDHIKQTAVPGELILLKSSGNLHLERVALAWTHDVRCWIPACGKKEGCSTCGLYEVPFEEHKSFLANRRLERRRRRFGWLLGLTRRS
ncbi:UDP-N-acetylmuramoyl-tripeptide--D-alanyl-D-alanine ligase [Mesorhizobium sp. CA18]|uniref:Mur ligase family protein n=1 Tax=unclassified Mesorhizobium TaxID=325217 RepID=UPI001CCE632E|nr:MULTISPECIES: Mur ligase family protein [unclassified Mesorhizobium]MBZ9737270.1 UDP-N-acetylmuramoyl-tripeptide--D-alanyl-D-alanine ligase [Mesorhizobium sp. CA9]MBZ9829104.1 UDP-N-acetylmuramoyl-tripeptide--D-alanyl-D-alanine ligase [Mesorhizobium sp. CA18]MBZ9834770.1 UDP-N-acetylmuramoyl-tripeptide--D-alanyl-D-alanine ligase [Mesorhizobium sp. CA2]MBZ9840542.1 UDP-N-acetylmuramoyl-tripeptide--D-alanyl-D-alanine ligase [Mesorhizobium sp. CA3]MBZ9880610.1 UDP-N-acetylmuramoyl-tripeptide--